MKKPSLSVAVIVAIIGCCLAVLASVSAGRLSDKLEGERYRRITAEQELLKAENENLRISKELEDTKSKIASIQEILTGSESANSTLKTQLEGVSQERKTLENRLSSLEQKIADSLLSQDVG